MNRRQIQFLALALLIVMLAIGGVVLASSGNGFAVGWFRLGPGGRSFCADGYSLTSAIGQVAVAESNGDSYSLISGVRLEAADCTSISLPVILRQH
ncbi:MAG TPA: hypothetical protein PK205_08135 [Promineifilum sp.]|nr:hypothetical protein [Promineifilum sp.]HRO22717.1 hypothetical protein [Promineifilum sp.]HRO90732.1 hypothetical protein [Promineifilum sp.]HRQ13260.1 hypothetical protein [Promineifilum sp.]